MFTSHFNIHKNICAICLGVLYFCSAGFVIAASEDKVPRFVGDWVYDSDIGIVWNYTAAGDPACAAFEGNQNCQWGATKEEIGDLVSHYLVCGEDHLAKWGGTGYSPDEWCFKLRNLTYNWKYNSALGVILSVDHDGDIQCASDNGTLCYWGKDKLTQNEKLNLVPLACGETGYNDPGHWCHKGLEEIYNSYNFVQNWEYDEQIGVVWNITSDGDPACVADKARINCQWGVKKEHVKGDFRNFLVCGADHLAKWGSTGYQPGGWCSSFRNKTYVWQYDPTLDVILSVNRDGDIQCASGDGVNCDWGKKVLSKEEIAYLNPVACGEDHTKKWGTDGYSDPTHWCYKSLHKQFEFKKSLVSAGKKVEQSNLDIIQVFSNTADKTSYVESYYEGQSAKYEKQKEDIETRLTTYFDNKIKHEGDEVANYKKKAKDCYIAVNVVAASEAWIPILAGAIAGFNAICAEYQNEESDHESMEAAYRKMKTAFIQQAETLLNREELSLDEQKLLNRELYLQTEGFPISFGGVEDVQTKRIGHLQDLENYYHDQGEQAEADLLAAEKKLSEDTSFTHVFNEFMEDVFKSVAGPLELVYNSIKEIDQVVALVKEIDRLVSHSDNWQSELIDDLYHGSIDPLFNALKSAGLYDKISKGDDQTKPVSNKIPRDGIVGVIANAHAYDSPHLLSKNANYNPHFWKLEENIALNNQTVNTNYGVLKYLAETGLTLPTSVGAFDPYYFKDFINRKRKELLLDFNTNLPVSKRTIWLDGVNQQDILVYYPNPYLPYLKDLYDPLAIYELLATYGSYDAQIKMMVHTLPDDRSGTQRFFGDDLAVTEKTTYSGSRSVQSVGLFSLYYDGLPSNITIDPWGNVPKPRLKPHRSKNPNAPITFELPKVCFSQINAQGEFEKVSFYGDKWLIEAFAVNAEQSITEAFKDLIERSAQLKDWKAEGLHELNDLCRDPELYLETLYPTKYVLSKLNENDKLELKNHLQTRVTDSDHASSIYDKVLDETNKLSFFKAFYQQLTGVSEEQTVGENGDQHSLSETEKQLLSYLTSFENETLRRPHFVGDEVLKAKKSGFMFTFNQQPQGGEAIILLNENLLTESLGNFKNINEKLSFYYLEELFHGAYRFITQDKCNAPDVRFSGAIVCEEYGDAGGRARDAFLNYTWKGDSSWFAQRLTKEDKMVRHGHREEVLFDSAQSQASSAYMYYYPQPAAFGDTLGELNMSAYQIYHLGITVSPIEGSPFQEAYLAQIILFNPFMRSMDNPFTKDKTNPDNNVLTLILHATLHTDVAATLDPNKKFRPAASSDKLDVGGGASLIENIGVEIPIQRLRELNTGLSPSETLPKYISCTDPATQYGECKWVTRASEGRYIQALIPRIELQMGANLPGKLFGGSQAAYAELALGTEAGYKISTPLKNKEAWITLLTTEAVSVIAADVGLVLGGVERLDAITATDIGIIALDQSLMSGLFQLDFWHSFTFSLDGFLKAGSKSKTDPEGSEPVSEEAETSFIEEGANPVGAHAPLAGDGSGISPNPELEAAPAADLESEVAASIKKESKLRKVLNKLNGKVGLRADIQSVAQYTTWSKTYAPGYLDDDKKKVTEEKQ